MLLYTGGCVNVVIAVLHDNLHTWGYVMFLLSCDSPLADCDFTVVDVDQKTALHWTAENSDSGCIQALIEAYPPLLNKKYIYRTRD